jgi:cytochrome c oxidase subunit 3
VKPPVTVGTVKSPVTGNNNLVESFQPVPVNRETFALSLFIGTEVMFFGGLISAFLILKAGAGLWPPVGQPRLPVFVTGVNTLFLLASGYTVHLAVKAAREARQRDICVWLAVTGLLGLLFLGIQGYEWVRLLAHGLTISSSTYGGTFYTLIGAHGLHVAAAVTVLLVVLSRALRGCYSDAAHTGVTLCRIYWLFVVGVWPVLFLLVYLA